MGKGYEYKVRRKDICMAKSELANAKGLPQAFEARYRAQYEPQERKAAFMNEDR